MKLPTRKQVADIAERAAWTLLEGGVAFSAVDALELPVAWSIPVMGALAAIKSALAVKFSDNGSAATLPSALDPAVPAGRHAAPEGNQ